MLVADALNSLIAGSTLTAAFAIEGVDTIDLITPSENLHPMFAEVMRIAPIEDPADRDGFGSMLGERYPGIAGVVIVQDDRG